MERGEDLIFKTRRSGKETQTEAEQMHELCGLLNERLGELGHLIRQQNDIMATMIGMLVDHLRDHPRKRSCIDSFKVPPDDPDKYLYGKS
jgi:hypothetical protein